MSFAAREVCCKGRRIHESRASSLALGRDTCEERREGQRVGSSVSEPLKPGRGRERPGSWVVAANADEGASFLHGVTRDLSGHGLSQLCISHFCWGGRHRTNPDAA